MNGDGLPDMGYRNVPFGVAVWLGLDPSGSLRTHARDLAVAGARVSSGLGSRFVAVGEVAVGEPPAALVRGQLPALVGSDCLRDPFVELWEGMCP